MLGSKGWKNSGHKSSLCKYKDPWVSSKSHRGFQINPLRPSISISILYTVLYAFPKVLIRRICWTIQSFHDLNVWFSSGSVRRNKMLKLGLKGFFAYYHKILSISCKDRLVLPRSKVNRGVREACTIPLYHPSLRLLSESCLWSQRIQRSLHCVKPLLVPCCPSEVQN